MFDLYNFYLFLISSLFLVAVILFFCLKISNNRTLSKNFDNLILNNVECEIFAWSSQTHYRIATKKLPALIGANVKKITSLKQIISCFSPSDQKTLSDSINELQKTRKKIFLIFNIGAQYIELHGDVLKRSKNDDLFLITFRSINHEKSAENILTAYKTINNIYKNTLDALPVPIWRRDKDLNLIDCNNAYVQAVEGTSHIQVVKEKVEITSDQIEHARKALETKESINRNCHIAFQGRRHWLKIVEFPHFENNNIIGITGFALDMTPLDEAEKGLKRHVEATTEVLENLTTAIAVFDATQRLNFFNQAYADLWKLDEHWLHREPSFSEILEAQREKRMLPEFVDFPAFKKIETKLFTTLIDSFEDMMYLPNDTTVRRRITPHPMGGLFFTYEDVTDTLALERSYHTKVEVERETINNLYEGIAVFGSDGRLKLNNKTYLNIWNIKESTENEPHISEILAMTEKEFRSVENYTNFKNTLINAIGEHRREKGRIECQNDNVIDYIAIPLPDGNVLFSFIDMSDSFRVERALLERNEALMTADRLKTEFLAHISYELRTPLNTILGFTEILLNEYFGKVNKKQKEYVEAILVSSKRLAALINDILDLALVEAGQVTLEKRSIDIQNMLDSVMNLSRESSRHHNVELCIECPDDIGFMNADERRIKQVLYNLVSNAIKFTPSAGKVILKAEKIKRKIVLSIIDTGIGIKHEDHKRIFEKFEQGSNLPARKTGLGLGLSLVKKVIELHGGEVTFDSTPNKGTCVACILPGSID